MKKLQFDLTYEKLAKWYLFAILLYLPFQLKIARENVITDSSLLSFLRMIDEITIAVFLPLAIIKILRSKPKAGVLYLIFGLSILLFFITGMVSGTLNSNSFLVTSLGNFDYMKNFLVVFIYSAFFRDFKEVKKIYQVLLAIVVFLGAVSLFQEVWAAGLRYVVGKDITFKDIYIFTNIYSSPEILPFETADIRWRYGLYRVESLTGKPFNLGLYSLLFFTLYIMTAGRLSLKYILLILSSIFFTLSRMIYTSLAFVMALFAFKEKKWIVVAFIPVFLVFCYLSYVAADADSYEIEQQSFRSYTREKAVEIWKDNSLLGAGPGMYGGITSVRYGSHIYDDYDFDNYHLKGGISQFGSIDQFWPQLLAETGVIGFSAFLAIMVSLALTLARLRDSTGNSEKKDFITGLLFYIYVINTYLLSSGLNLTPVIYTYFAFVGMVLGSVNDNEVRETAE